VLSVIGIWLLLQHTNNKEINRMVIKWWLAQLLDTCIIIIKYLLFADDVKISLSINNVHDCQLLQSGIDSMQNWCFENGVIRSVGKTTINYIL
jgi:hypothetical protein